MLAWYTNHFISQKVILRHTIGGFGVPAKHTSLFKKEDRHKYEEEAILYGILRGCGEVIHHNFKKGIDYLHIDNGYIKRNHFDGYYRISLNDTQAQYKDVNLPNDRAKKLDVKLEDWKENKDGFILIVPHTPAMEIFYGININDWVNSTIKKINGLPYKVREKDDLTPLKNDLDNCRCVITFNSNLALDATLAGVPVIATSKHSVVRDWNNLTMDNVLNCYEKSISLDRNKLLNFISYHQFTLSEIEKGLAKNIINEMRKRGVY